MTAVFWLGMMNTRQSSTNLGCPFDGVQLPGGVP